MLVETKGLTKRYGSFLALERTSFATLPIFRSRLACHIYTMAVIFFANVFFRCDSIPQALGFLTAMTSLNSVTNPEYPLALYFDRQLALVLPLAILASTPWPGRAKCWLQAKIGEAGLAVTRGMLLSLMLLGSAMALAAGTHNPFIYFRF